MIKNSSELYAFHGEQSKPILRSKCNEVCRYIKDNHHLGLRGAKFTEIDAKITSRDLQSQKQTQFWETLHAESLDIKNQLQPCSIENYKITDFNTAETLLSASKPSITILDPMKILLCDFGSEYYVWFGNRVDANKKSESLKIIHENFKNLNRPEFTLFAKVAQGVESALFQEKFYDWSNIDKERKKFGSKKSENEKIVQSSITNFQDPEFEKLLVRPTGDGINSENVASGDGEYVSSDGRVMCIKTLASNLNGVDIGPGL